MGNLFDELNDLDIDLSEYEITQLDDLEKQKMKNRLKKITLRDSNMRGKRHIGKIAALLGLLILSPVLADGVSATIGLVSRSIESMTNVDEGKLKEYKDVINTNVSDNGYTVQLNEVMFDVDSVLISSTIKINEGELPFVTQEGFEYLREREVYIKGIEVNGKEISHVMESDSRGGDNTSYTLLSRHFYEEDIDISGDVDVKVVCGYYSADGVNEDYEWEFNFKANVDKMRKDIKINKIEKDITVNNESQMKLNKIAISPTTVVISGKITGDEKYAVEYVVVDDLGNKLNCELTSTENGTERTYKYSAPNEEATKLIIKPVVTSKETEEYKELTDQIIEVNLK